MQGPEKKIKTSHFENEKEASDFIDLWLRGDPHLPKDIWIKILSSNSELTVQDIHLMCQVNSFFNGLCESGEIWNALFLKEFGQEKQDAWDQLGKDYYWMTPSKKSLLRLLTARIILDKNGQLKDWTLEREKKIHISSQENGFVIDNLVPVFNKEWSKFNKRKDFFSDTIEQLLEHWDALIWKVVRSSDADLYILKFWLNEPITQRSELVESTLVFHLLALNMTTPSKAEYYCTTCHKIF